MAFLGKDIDGKCPHCQKKQAWMRMGYSLWVSLLGVMALMTAFGFFSIATFEGRSSQLQTIQTVTGAVTAATLLLAAALVIHAVIMMSRIRRQQEESPVIIARTVEELLAQAGNKPIA